MAITTATELLHAAFDAHGGLLRWRALREARAVYTSAGPLLEMKGQRPDPTRRCATLSLRRVQASIEPFGAADQRSVFTTGRVAVEKLDGTVVAEQADVRATFAGHQAATPWTPLQRAYFSGYAMWTYLNSPFLLANPKVRLEMVPEIDHVGETLHGIEALFPAELPTHSRRQRFYFGSDGVLRRHDYRVDVVGGLRAAQFLDDFVVADGITVPTMRQAYTRDDDGRVLRDRPLLTITFLDVRFAGP